MSNSKAARRTEIERLTADNDGPITRKGAICGSAWFARNVVGGG
jgi:hypothetical protein